MRVEGGAPIGNVEWHAERYGSNRGSRAWNIGIFLMPSERGRGCGTEAQRLLATHLFETTDGGKHWVSWIPGLPFADISALSFGSNTLGLAIGSAGLLRTTDGGHTWMIQATE